ncbi:MAG: hypothetical protein MUO30_05380 [Anaerolineales bacterium]|nr:hypothetical protein [Anaerolineales bacterium]
MSASGYIIVVLVLAVAIAGAIGYLLLANKKRGRSLMGEKPEIQKGESTKPLAETERQSIEEAHTH